MYYTLSVISTSAYNPLSAPVSTGMRRKSHTGTGSVFYTTSKWMGKQKYYQPRVPRKQLRRSKMREDIQTVLNRIRPALQADGGDVELIDVTDGVVSVRLTGACGGCPMATMTLKQGIERVLREQLPDVKEVVSV
jgi:Fe-S cluster biogenesis protein NfuA